MKKPEPPKSRLIRVDVLPEQDPMKNFRIKKVTDRDGTRYYPQHKFLGLFWKNMFSLGIYWDGSYKTFEEAQRNLCNYLKEPVVEYLSVDCGDGR